MCICSAYLLIFKKKIGILKKKKSNGESIGLCFNLWFIFVYITDKEYLVFI